MVGKSYSRSYDYAGEVDGGQVPEWLEEVQRWWRLATRAFSFFSIYPHFEILATPLLRPFSSQQDFHSCVIYRGLISHLNFWLFVACCCGMWRPQHFTRGSILKDGLHFLWRHYWQWGVVACPYQRRRLVCIVWYWMGGLSLKTRLPADVTVTTALLWGVVACPYQRRRKRRKQKTPAFVGHPLNHRLPHPHPLPHPFVGHPLNHSSASSVFSFSKRPVTLPLGTQQMCICKRGYLVNCQLSDLHLEATREHAIDQTSDNNSEQSVYLYWVLRRIL